MAVTAINKKGQKQVFSDMAWKLLGTKKGGWTAVESNTMAINSVTADNAVKKMPDMGDDASNESKSQAVDNSLTAEGGKQSVDNSLDNKAPVKTDLDKEAEFMGAVQGIAKSAIKDFFDNKKVKYNKKADDETLQIQLAQYLKFNIVELQKAFN